MSDKLVVVACLLAVPVGWLVVVVVVDDDDDDDVLCRIIHSFINIFHSLFLLS